MVTIHSVFYTSILFVSASEDLGAEDDDDDDEDDYGDYIGGGDDYYGDDGGYNYDYGYDYETENNDTDGNDRVTSTPPSNRKKRSATDIDK